jgi:LuxR family maltose regulon positive regulatory protein
LGLQTTLVDWLYRWNVAQAQLREAAGDLETALALLDEAKRVYIQTLVPDLRPIAALKARIYLKQGRPDKARAWAAERGLALADEVSYLHEFEHLTLARLEIANPLVNALLARLLQTAEAQKRRGSALDILLVQALAHEAQGNRPQALAALKRALALAEPEGYIRIFVDEGKPMAELLTRIDAKDETLRFKEYILKLLSAFDMHKEFRPSGSTPVEQDRPSLPVKQVVSPQPLIEPLSERELEVLKLLRTDLNGPEIARECMVSLSTIRTHTQNIYAKLGVNNRRAAVRRAEELDLF